MYYVQRLSQGSESERRCRVRNNAEVTIGSGPECDLRLHISFGLPAVSVRIRAEEDRCLAENLTGDPGLVFINGQSVFGTVALEDGDALQVGSDQFAVVRRREESPGAIRPAGSGGQKDKPAEPQTAAAQRVRATDAGTQQPALLRSQQHSAMSTHGASQTSANPDSASRVTPHEHAATNFERTLTSSPINSAVTVHIPTDSRWTDMDALQHLCTRQRALLLVNFRHAAQPVSSGSVCGDDLYTATAADVRQRDSLHVVSEASVRDKLELYDDLKDLDSVIWCFPAAESDTDACIMDIRLHLAWFSRSSTLRTAVRESTPDFCGALLANFDGILLPSPEMHDSWELYTSRQKTPWSLGLTD